MVRKIENKLYETWQCKFTCSCEVFGCFSIFFFEITTVIGIAYQGIDILKFALVLALDSPWFYVIRSRLL